MHIWVDADACPKPVKEILFRAAVRAQVPVILVANQYLSVPPSPLIRAVQVSSGFDVADNHIVQSAQVGDLVITADIPLAAEAVAKGVAVINPRGERYTLDNVRQRLNMRDFMETLRSSGIQSGGPAPYSQQDKQAFANALDRFLAAAR
ncbi:YaiI/YqxD family protein [Cellvibrio sp. ARAG 10.3]|jgi:uncharacterized protein|uniref:YaiI/YqxD family protein n=1 Tax=Cellvibrio sp. ARAG 10.3 TaxID=3451358 RepID=UPI002BAA14CB|nr:YaiI/YqxD family protein [Cellvibrio sp.]